METKDDDLLQNNYFELLPQELLIEILKHVSTGDMLNFCETYSGYEYLFQDRTLTSKIDLSRYHKADVKSISSKLKVENVTVLNINGCHWLAVHNLRCFIKKLVNLKKLSALRTKLSLCKLDGDAYAKTKIEKIALTLTHNTIVKAISTRTFPTIAGLCLELDVKDLDPDLLLPKFPNVETIWVESQYVQPLLSLFDWLELTNPEKLRQIVFASFEQFYYGFPFTIVEKYYYGRKQFQPEVLCYHKPEHFEDIELKNPEVPSPWELIDNYTHDQNYEPYCVDPHGPKDVRRLYLRSALFHSIEYEELNFGHKYCNKKFLDVYRAALKSANAKRVRKLALSNCLLEDIESSCKYKITKVGAKRRINDDGRNQNESSSLLSGFQDVTHFECYACPLINCPSLHAYSQIAKFTKLKSFYVDVPEGSDGHFLIEVLEKCTQLETLFINALMLTDDSINCHVREALKCSTSLKEFTFAHERLETNDLLTSLIAANQIKLRKLGLTCITNCAFSVDLLTEYLHANPQLMYCRFRISLSTEREEEIRAVLRQFHKSYRIIDFGQLVNKYPSHLKLDVNDMRSFRSSVCCPNIMEGFESF